MEFLTDLGYLGLFIGSFLASTVVPFSADLLLAGILLTGADPWICLTLATLGNWLGGLTSYIIGYIGKWEWIEKWFKVKPEQLIKQKDKINQYGNLLAFLTWLPIVGDVFAIGLGFYRISPKLSAIYMLIGRFIRFLVWTLLYLQYGQQFLDWISR
ncbi:DedA family protein [Porphyromonadaceae bacterium OttesenSCG-928-L07]|nr:DedA family protein [Porphyromonadaceae bacterium OttesenSCG-928-L07]MDL2252355.1 DedA family protein [Odoribacter sp. OttesenSCG-928-J03]MDL2331144.1 DedA family protein [Odoribacter sp. OttesenSCG-928-A06]